MTKSTLRNIFMAGAFVLAGAASAHADGDAQRGQEVFAKCSLCHEIGDGAANRVGPQLNGVVGSAAASRSGFEYSRALNEARRNGLTWTRENLHAYLANPRAFLTGGRMAFAGLHDEQEREDIIAYLATFE
ncbi:c-type cytochrome [Tepidamorphus sp. 3E244]|uniref:c-type cytochrome n=1 Tax=Tepidamorphus sp. 3E244 TaxID=3385498 RepID=UPI0038FCABE1